MFDPTPKLQEIGFTTNDDLGRYEHSSGVIVPYTMFTHLPEETFGRVLEDLKQTVATVSHEPQAVAEEYQAPSRTVSPPEAAPEETAISKMLAGAATAKDMDVVSEAAESLVRDEDPAGEATVDMDEVTSMVKEDFEKNPPIKEVNEGTDETVPELIGEDEEADDEDAGTVEEAMLGGAVAPTVHEAMFGGAVAPTIREEVVEAGEATGATVPQGEDGVTAREGFLEDSGFTRVGDVWSKPDTEAPDITVQFVETWSQDLDAFKAFVAGIS